MLGSHGLADGGSLAFETLSVRFVVHCMLDSVACKLRIQGREATDESGHSMMLRSGQAVACPGEFFWQPPCSL